MASERKVSSPGFLMGKVAKVLSTSRVVVNKGSADGVKLGDKFVVFVFGEEIQDPDTHENLGRLQLVKGRAEAVVVQDRISVIEAVEYTLPSASFTFGAAQAKRVVKAFANPEVGDLATRYDPRPR